MSIKVGKEPGAEDMCPPRKFVDPDFGTGRPLSTPRLYTPEQQYNYKSQYARYLKGLNLKPGSITTEGKCEVYTFHSCDAPSRSWTVKVCPSGATFIEAGKPLTILCPPENGYQLNQVESDGESFTWTQLSGSRTVAVEPASDKNPTLFIESSCFTEGCVDNSYLPIITQVTVDGNAELFDYLTIYTTPTSTHYDISLSVANTSIKPCHKLNWLLCPAFYEKGYEWAGTPLGITWTKPTCNYNHLQYVYLQINNNGNYETIEVYNLTDDWYAEISANQHYRLVAEFNNKGKLFYAIAKPIFIAYPLNFLLELNDDSINVGGLVKAVNKQEKKVFTVESCQVVDLYNKSLGLIKGQSKQQKISFSVESVNQTDNLKSDIAIIKVRQKYRKNSFGGVIIG